MSGSSMEFKSPQHGHGCLTPRQGWATAPRISASSCDGAWPSIPFLFRGSVGCGISFGGISDIGRKRFARHSNRRLGGSTEIISGHRDPRDLLPNGPLDCTYHRNFVGRHEGEGVARSRRSAGPADAVNVVFRLLRNVVVDDVTDAGDIESALGDVRRDEHANLP